MKKAINKIVKFETHVSLKLAESKNKLLDILYKNIIDLNLCYIYIYNLIILK